MRLSPAVELWARLFCGQIVVQNSRDTPVWIRPGSIELDCTPPAAVAPTRAVLDHPGWGAAAPPPTRRVSDDAEGHRYIPLLPLTDERNTSESRVSKANDRGDHSCCRGHTVPVAAEILTLVQQHNSGCSQHGVKKKHCCDTAEIDESGTAVCLRKRWSFVVLGGVRFPVGTPVLGAPKLEPEA
eukprot:SAG31_NODE_5058_length_2768_cov_1.632072_1_plen_183_part_10